jgi:hypothetical protein
VTGLAVGVIGGREAVKRLFSRRHLRQHSAVMGTGWDFLPSL